MLSIFKGSVFKSIFGTSDAPPYPTPYYLLEHYPTDLALSLRRIYPGAQYCCRIRRGDGDELDLGFSSTPIVIPNFTGELTTYLVDMAAGVAFANASAVDPGEATLSRLYIQDREANNVLYASQSVAADQPIVIQGGEWGVDPTTNMPAMYTDGISQFMNLPNVSWSHNKGYIMHAIVARIGRIDSIVAASLVFISSNASTGTRYNLRQTTTANKAGMSVRRINSGSNALIESVVDHDGTPHVFSGYADYTNNIAKYRQDAGDEVTGNTVSAGLTANTDASVQYIARSPVGYLEAYISEIIMWNTNTYAANLENEIELNLIQTYFGG